MTRWFLDACSLINLYASSILETISQEHDSPFLVVQMVVDEAGWVYSREGVERGERRPIQYPLLFQGQQLSIVPSTPSMLQRFLNFAAYMDDGEAMTLAAALEIPGSGIVTDDEAAMHHVTQAGIPVTTSLALLRTALKGTTASQSREVLLNLRLCARYVPGQQHPQYAWWQSMLQETEARSALIR